MNMRIVALLLLVALVLCGSCKNLELNTSEDYASEVLICGGVQVPVHLNLSKESPHNLAYCVNSIQPIAVNGEFVDLDMLAFVYVLRTNKGIVEELQIHKDLWADFIMMPGDVVKVPCLFIFWGNSR